MTKEVIALALGVAAYCDGCLGYHTRAWHGYSEPECPVLSSVAKKASRAKPTDCGPYRAVSLTMWRKCM